jgi:threonine dehydrogenase-like Zn-dependent dehydrogenase
MGEEQVAIPFGGTVAVFARRPVGLMTTIGACPLGAALVIVVEDVSLRQEQVWHASRPFSPRQGSPRRRDSHAAEDHQGEAAEDLRRERFLSRLIVRFALPVLAKCTIGTTSLRLACRPREL